MGSRGPITDHDTPWGYRQQDGSLVVAVRTDPLHYAWMDPRDQLRALLDGTTCTVCHEPVPAERIRLLARREDLTFVQIQCDRCGSTALGFLGNSSIPDSGERGVARPGEPRCGCRSDQFRRNPRDARVPGWLERGCQEPPGRPG